MLYNGQVTSSTIFMSLRLPAATVWDTNSFVTHAVSNSVNGTYTKSDVVATHWAHNPQAVVFQNEVFVFHIGSGNGSQLVKCPYDNDSGYSSSPTDAAITGRKNPQVTYILSSPGPNGPWTSEPIVVCDNPSPLVLRNGTVLLMCSRSPEGNGPHWRLHSAATPRGPWTTVQEIFPRSNETNDSAEDPFLWEDKNGYLHVLAHVGPPGHDADQPSRRLSMHGYSKDGVDWRWSANQPYNSTVVYEDGSSIAYCSAERPKLFLDQEGTPTHLINGLSSHLWPCNGCPAEGYTNVCNKCKLTKGIDYTYTMMRPLAWQRD
jgi:hypothetical protein